MEDNYPVYFIKKGRKLVRFSRISDLIKKEKIKPEFDFETAKFFLTNNGIVPSDRTLIKNVFKEVNSDFDNKKLSFSEVLNIVELNINNLIKNQNTINMCLSSGYDSNFILHEIKNKNPILKINAFCVKGKKVDESKAVKKIVKNYKNVNLNICSPGKVIGNIKELVKITEGYAFERGMFVQLSVAKKIFSKKGKSVILADGADQLFDKFRLSFFGKLINQIKRKISISFLGDIYYKKNNLPPFGRKVFLKSNVKPISNDWEKDTIIKKSFLIFNYFGIKTHYPFLFNFKYKNYFENILNFRKYLYKQKLKTIFSKKISSNINKIPGSVDLSWMIDRKILKLIATDVFFKKIIDEKLINKIIKDKEIYYSQILQLLYLYFFNQIFIEKKSN